jgi:hypothetical protein
MNLGRLTSALAIEARTTPTPATPACICSCPTRFAEAADVLALLTKPPSTLMPKKPILPK